MKLKKQKLLKVLLSKISQVTKIDYLLYLGADTGNESVYQFLRSKRSDQYFTREHKKYICTLGKKPSSAFYYLDDLDEVKFMLGRLKASGQKRKKNRSYSDLRDLQSVGSPFANDMNSSQMRVDYSSSNVSGKFLKIYSCCISFRLG